MNLIALALLVLATPQTSAPPSGTARMCPQATVTLEAPLDLVLRDYEAAWSRGDEKALAALFSEDGFVMSRGGMPRRGREAIRSGYAGSGGGPLALRPIAVATEGSIGLILGCYSEKPGDPEIGKFTLTLKKDATGRWLIFSDMDNANGRN